MPLVDACMRELNATGYIPTRGRMLVAQYLTVDIKQDWRYGAAYFEEKLIDYDVHSNYGGFNFSAGLSLRVINFNLLKASKEYDSKGKYIKLWCSELKDVPEKFIHRPRKMPDLI